MKIFQVVPYYPPHMGGMEFYVQSLSEGLAARGHEVTVFTSSQNNRQSTSIRNGVRICSLKILTKVYNVPIVPNIFTQLLETVKPDVIHTHQYPVFFSDIAATVSRLKKIPLIVHVHVVSDAKSPISGVVSDWYYKTLGLRTLRAADRIIVPSLAYKDKIAKMHVSSSKIQVIPYGIDTRKFENNQNGLAFKKMFHCENAKVILSVGRLNYQKGFQYLIRAMPGIIKEIPGVKLMIVGEGEESQYLKQLTISLGVSDNVLFTGALSNEQIPDAYAACDVFVLPSIFESFGISLIEAQSSGKPVIATLAGGAPEALVSGKTGFLVQPGNILQLQKAVVNVLSNQTLIDEMGLNGKAFVASKFAIQSVTDDVVCMYQKLS